MKRRPNKYVCGEPMRDFCETILEISESHKWFFVNGKAQHSVAIRNISLIVLISCFRSGRICRAEINPAWVEWMRSELEALT